MNRISKLVGIAAIIASLTATASMVQDTPPDGVFAKSTWGTVTNLLSFVTAVDVDAGMATHFNDMTALYPSTGQNFTMLTFGKGKWQWKLAITHSDTFFNGGVEDEFGPSISVWHINTPPPVIGVLDHVKPRTPIDLSEFSIKLGVFNSTTSIFNGQLGTGTSGIRLVGSFKAF